MRLKSLRSLFQSPANSQKKGGPENPWEKLSVPTLWIISVVSLTSVVGHRFYNQPRLAVNTVAPSEIKAPRDGSFQDPKTTEAKQKEIRTGIVTVLRQDPDITRAIEAELAKLVNQIDEARQLAGPTLFLTTQTLMPSVQTYLRSCGAEEWATIKQSLNSATEINLSTLDTDLAITDLRLYQDSSSTQDLNALIDKIEVARDRYQKAYATFEKDIPLKIEPYEIRELLNTNYQTWQGLTEQIFYLSSRMLTQGIPPGLPDHQLEEAIRANLGLSYPEETIALATKILMAVMEPNLTEDLEATKKQAEQAVKDVKPVIVEIKAGEVIVDKGEVITQEQFVLLDGFRLSRRSVNWMALAGSAVVVSGAGVLFNLIAMRLYRPMRRRDYLFITLLSLTSPLLGIFKIQYTNLSAIGLLSSSFYGSGVAVTQIIITTGLHLYSTGGLGWEYLLPGAVGGLITAMIAHRMRSREELALLGGAVSGVQITLYLTINLIISASAGAIWQVILWESMLYGASGMAWIIAAIGISPIFERLFDLVTSIRLAELSNPNRPLLKRLATEAPGTFQHTLFVSSLAEAAARELHCNVELVRAGTLFHDIGKMHDPLGFIENQMGGPNKHDEIDDPWKSAQIIKKHVTEGLVMARKAGLPGAIQAFIPEHQGTLLISYFYAQALERSAAEGKTVNMDDFRYDGPIPQTPEAGIMMLADGCEAALRSLKNASPEQALQTVKNIFKARWNDGQLADSGLTFDDLPTIADVFINVWQQFNHQRIAYPKAISITTHHAQQEEFS